MRTEPNTLLGLKTCRNRRPMLLHSMRAMRDAFRLGLIISTVLLVFHAHTSRSANELPSDAWQAWQVIDTKTGGPIAFNDWITILAEKDVIYLGEEHRNKWHIEAALRILRALIDRHHRPALAMEMFGWDGQVGLNQYLAEEKFSRDQFLAAARWEQNWGGSFEDYEPLIAFARERHVPVLALNPPRPLVRRVAMQGLEPALTEADMRRWGMQDEIFVEDSAYRDVIVTQLRLCHGGLSDEGYQRMYEASLFRDEGMAKTIADYLSGHTTPGPPQATTAPSRPGRAETRSFPEDVSLPENGTDVTGPLISYTGGGHIQYHLPVPNRVHRKSSGAATHATVYMTSFTPDSVEEMTHLLHDRLPTMSGSRRWATTVHQSDAADAALYLLNCSPIVIPEKWLIGESIRSRLDSGLSACVGLPSPGQRRIPSEVFASDLPPSALASL